MWGNVQIQQLVGVQGDLGAGQIAVPHLAAVVEDVFDRRHEPLGAVCGQADAQGHLVRRKEADAVEVVGQTVGIGAHHIDGLVAIALIYADSEKGADAVGLEEHHDFTDGAVLDPGGADRFQFFLGDAFDLGQAFHILFEDVQGVAAEMADDLAGRLGPHALDQSGSQVFFQGGAGGRLLFDGFMGPELASMGGVGGPGTAKGHGGAGKHPGLMDDDGLLTAGLPQRGHPQHRPPVTGIVVGDAVHDAVEGLDDNAGMDEGSRRHDLKPSKNIAYQNIKKPENPGASISPSGPHVFRHTHALRRSNVKYQSSNVK